MFSFWLSCAMLSIFCSKKLIVEVLLIDESSFKDMPVLMLLLLGICTFTPYLNMIWAMVLYVMSLGYLVKLSFVYKIKFTDEELFGFKFYKKSKSYYDLW